MNLLAATFLTVLASTSAHTDTMFSVKPGARLNVFNFGGGVHVTTWPRDEVRIQADHTALTKIEIQRKGPVLLVASRARQVPARDVYYDIQVPHWIHVNIDGINNDVSVDGVDGEVLVETVRGGVNVKGGKGLISLRSLEGAVRVEGARGRVQASSVNDGVVVIDVVGEVVANTVNGNITLGRVVSDLVEASSANGDLIWDGDFKKSGRYQFGTHNGDILVITADRPNATVSVETFSGDFESNFPVQLRETRQGQGMSFTLGDGSALVDFESFQGAIRLLKAGSDQARQVLDRQAQSVDQLRVKIERKREQLERMIERRREREKEREKERLNDRE
jgi:Toastrack DUF4097